jgi:hypothetical protein
MEMLIIARFSKVNYEEWLAAFEADGEMRSKFMKNDVVGKVNDHTAVIKTTIFDQEAMEEAMAIRMPELVEQMGIEHEMFVLTPAG